MGDVFCSADDQYDYWKGLFESIVDKHALIKWKRVREKDTPFMTPEWKQAIRDKRKFAIFFAKNRTPENFGTLQLVNVGTINSILTQEIRRVEINA